MLDGVRDVGGRLEVVSTLQSLRLASVALALGYQVYTHGLRPVGWDLVVDIESDAFVMVHSADARVVVVAVAVTKSCACQSLGKLLMGIKVLREESRRS